MENRDIATRTALVYLSFALVSGQTWAITSTKRPSFLAFGLEQGVVGEEEEEGSS